MAKRRKQEHPFKQQEEKGMFAFDPPHRYAFKWGLVAGLAGGIFMTRPDSFLLQLIGVAVVIFISNYHINRLTQWIPRWHATIITMLGAGLGMFGMIFASPRPGTPS